MLFDLQNSPSDYLEYRFNGQTGATPLHVAAANGYLSVVEYLVRIFWWLHIYSGWYHRFECTDIRLGSRLRESYDPMIPSGWGVCKFMIVQLCKF